MEEKEIKILCKKRGLPYKGDFLSQLSEEEFRAGCIKFYIPLPESKTGESIWGWIYKKDRPRYERGSFSGEMKAILCNTPLSYYGVLFWGSEVMIKCENGRAVISDDWVRKYILEAEWFKHEEGL